MAQFISRPSFVLHDDVRLHRSAGYLFVTVGLLILCWRPFIWILWGGLIAAGATALWRAKRNSVLVEIGPNGIWRGAEFITDWNGFVSARITTERDQDYRRRSIVHQILEIDHQHMDGSVFRRKLNISDAPDFNTTALLEAIDYFQSTGVGFVPQQPRKPALPR
ncbi:MAG: hypothetical protein EOO08_04400 [Chitinophagaceae bacterium]|nr:MAG: hypothetical protein EOO08_04400 [Chitinophagaceae bacterium]